MNHYFINGSFTESFENIGNNNRPTYNLIDNRRVIEGFATTVHPAAKAGAIFQENKYKGKFQGEMQPATPTG